MPVFFSNYHIHKWVMKNCKLENRKIRESYKYIDPPIPKQWQLLNLKSLTVWPRSNFSSNYLHLSKLHTMRMKQVIIERRQCWFVNKLLSWRPSRKKTRVKYGNLMSVLMPKGILRISSGGNDRRILLGFEIFDSGIFLAGKIL